MSKHESEVIDLCYSTDEDVRLDTVSSNVEEDADGRDGDNDRRSRVSTARNDQKVGGKSTNNVDAKKALDFSDGSLSDSSSDDSFLNGPAAFPIRKEAQETSMPAPTILQQTITLTPVRKVRRKRKIPPNNTDAELNSSRKNASNTATKPDPSSPSLEKTPRSQPVKNRRKKSKATQNNEVIASEPKRQKNQVQKISLKDTFLLNERQRRYADQHLKSGFYACTDPYNENTGRGKVHWCIMVSLSNLIGTEEEEGITRVKLSKVIKNQIGVEIVQSKQMGGQPGWEYCDMDLLEELGFVGRDRRRKCTEEKHNRFHITVLGLQALYYVSQNERYETKVAALSPTIVQSNSSESKGKNQSQPTLDNYFRPAPPAKKKLKFLEEDEC